MSIVEARIRLLSIRLKRFFNTIAVLPVRVLTAFRVVVPYENALHRIEVWKMDADAIDMGSTGSKVVKEIPVGEIWIPEHIRMAITTGTTARYNQIQVKRKGSADVLGFDATFTEAVNVDRYRHIHWSRDNWLYPGDELRVNISTDNAGDKGNVYVQRRVLRVGDDF